MDKDLSIFLIQDIGKVGLLEDFTTMGTPTVAGKWISVKRYEYMEILNIMRERLKKNNKLSKKF